MHSRKLFYQIQERRMVPSTSSIITLLRWPPIQSSTNKMLIYSSNSNFPIYKHSTLSCCSTNKYQTKQKKPHQHSLLQK
uniref:Putative ovule protein n=1 Tax=Solanum chacoense TaxID=4108 RepID=A0A0V0IH65_SOLCH